MPREKISDEEIIELNLEGFTDEEIAERKNVIQQTVCKRRNEIGLPQNGKWHRIKAHKLALGLIERKGPMLVDELSKNMEETTDSIRRNIREHKTPIKQVRLNLGSDTKYRATDMMKGGYTDRNVYYLDEERLADLIKEIIKPELSEDMKPGKKRALTQTLHDQLPEKTFLEVLKEYSTDRMLNDWIDRLDVEK